MSPSSGDGEHFVAKQALDREDGLDVLWPIASLTAFSSNRSQECFKLALPVSEGMDLYAGDAASNTDAHRLVVLMTFFRRHVPQNSFSLKAYTGVIGKHW